ncbi:MAG: transposase [Gemmatimonadota bacterium]|nr:transposase [Gemmatimonadota bacterium]
MKARRSFTPKQRLQIVLEGLEKDASIAEVCRRHAISTTLYYHWRDQLFTGAERLFAARRNGAGEQRLAELEAERVRLQAVIAEITAENLELKKTTGGSRIMRSFPRSSGR